VTQSRLSPRYQSWESPSPTVLSTDALGRRRSGLALISRLDRDAGRAVIEEARGRPAGATRLAVFEICLPVAFFPSALRLYKEPMGK
jgi:hypothetical protein